MGAAQSGRGVCVIARVREFSDVDKKTRLQRLERRRVKTVERLLELSSAQDSVLWMTAGACLYELGPVKLEQETGNFTVGLRPTESPGERARSHTLSAAILGLGENGEDSVLKVWVLRQQAEEYITCA